MVNKLLHKLFHALFAKEKINTIIADSCLKLFLVMLSKQKLCDGYLLISRFVWELVGVTRAFCILLSLWFLAPCSFNPLFRALFQLQFCSTLYFQLLNQILLFFFIQSFQNRAFLLIYKELNINVLIKEYRDFNPYICFGH